MLDFLKQEGIDSEILHKIEEFRADNPLEEGSAHRVPRPVYRYYGNNIWEMALTALLSGENLLLVGPKETKKNVLAENLAAVFNRPEWDVSFYLNTDAASLIGTDTFRDGKVTLRHGPIYQCAEMGGFGILDEINMAKNESLAVLHATLDFRRIIDVPGYDRITLKNATRFIATMNYGYAGTRELNEALMSRFMVINMPLITQDNLKKLLMAQYPALKEEYAEQFSTKALDLRGLLGSVKLIRNGLTAEQALEMGIVNKSTDDFERQIVSDVVAVRISGKLTASDIFR